MPVRGILQNSAGPLTAEDLSLMTGFPERIFALAFSELQKPGIQWILANFPVSPDAPGESPSIPGHVGAEGNRTEQKGTEGNGREEGSVASLLDDLFFCHPNFLAAWNSWEDFRKSIKPKLTSHARTLNFQQVKKLSGGDVENAIEIVNQTLRNGWKGFFELKDKKNATDKKPSQQYENAQQRNARRIREEIARFTDPGESDPGVDHQDVRIMP